MGVGLRDPGLGFKVLGVRLWRYFQLGDPVCQLLKILRARQGVIF